MQSVIGLDRLQEQRPVPYNEPRGLAGTKPSDAASPHIIAGVQAQCSGVTG